MFNCAFICVIPLVLIEDSLACQGEQLTLNCPNDDDVLLILDAFYGRKNLLDCAAGDDTTVTSANASCNSSLALAAVSTLCNGKKTCLITVGDGLLGQDCGGDAKYLEVAHSCASKRRSLVIRLHYALLRHA